MEQIPLNPFIDYYVGFEMAQYFDQVLLLVVTPEIEYFCKIFR